MEQLAHIFPSYRIKCGSASTILSRICASVLDTKELHGQRTDEAIGCLDRRYPLYGLPGSASAARVSSASAIWGVQGSGVATLVSTWPCARRSKATVARTARRVPAWANRPEGPNRLMDRLAINGPMAAPRPFRSSRPRAAANISLAWSLSLAWATHSV